MPTALRGHVDFIFSEAMSYKVSYTYSEMSGNNNHSRLTRLAYPNGREIVFHYNGLDSQVSRLSSLSDSSGTLERYEYLGLGTVVERRHPDTGVRLSYIKRNSEPVGDAGDLYTGLDRFGRVVDQRWLKGNNDVDRYRYGYDRDSNRLYKENVLDAVFSELYHESGPTEGYDPLNQLTGFERGILSDTDFDGLFDTVASPTREQSWELDALGNWSSLTTDGSTETRTHNLQNEVTQVGANALTFDANGNTTTDDTGRQLIYDAWNRLVEVKTSGGATIVRYGYDSLNRRIRETKTGVNRDFYYSDQWQVLEERVNGVAQIQYVWSPVYVDAMILRDRDTDNNGSLDERLYVLQDANWNVTALVNPAGQAVERYVYDPYGQATVLAPNWTNRPTSLYSWQHLHQGGRFDADVGLYHFRNRDYSPTLGRWIQRDPIENQNLNLYCYVNNNPLNIIDPFGLQGGCQQERDLLDILAAIHLTFFQAHVLVLPLSVASLLVPARQGANLRAAQLAIDRARQQVLRFQFREPQVAINMAVGVMIQNLERELKGAGFNVAGAILLPLITAGSKAAAFKFFESACYKLAECEIKLGRVRDRIAYSYREGKEHLKCQWGPCPGGVVATAKEWGTGYWLGWYQWEG